MTELRAWEDNEIPMWFKALVVAWYGKHCIVETHRQDAQAEAAKRRQRKER